MDSTEYVNDKYVTSLEISADPKMFLILTDKHILLMKENYVFGNQNLEWACEVPNLIAPPIYYEQKIKFMIKVCTTLFYNIIKL